MLPQWLTWILFVLLPFYAFVIPTDYLAGYFYLVCAPKLRFDVSISDLLGDRSKDPVNYNGVTWFLPQFSGIITVILLHFFVWIFLIIYITRVMSTSTYKGIKWNYIFDKLFYKKS